jgi:pimeloyl-ACP methyl ester carboxylesterase
MSIINRRGVFGNRNHLLVGFATLLALMVAAPATGHTRPNAYHIGITLPGRPPIALYVEDVSPAAVPKAQRTQDRAIVFLHGLGASTYMWRRLLPVVARSQRVIAIDLKGFGRSDKPVDRRYRIEEHAALVRAVIAKLGLRDVTLVGHSFGGAVALLLAVDAERVGDLQVSRLILMNSPAFQQPPSAGVAFLRKPLLPYLALNILPPEIAAQGALTSIGGDRSQISRQDVEAYAQPFMFRGARHALIETGRGIEPENFEELIRRYPRLKQPTLLIWCRRDPVVPLVFGQRLAKTLPRAELHIIDSCRHVPPEQAPLETERLVTKFLNGRG